MQKVALITGGSSGIGEATAKLFANKGFKVYACARNIQPIVEFNNPNIIPLKMDVTNSQSIAEAIKQITEDKIDILVNNAGFGIYGAVEETDLTTAKDIFNTNVFGLADVTKQLLPLIKKSSDGRIINISSVSGRFVNPFGAWYCASKFALEAFSDALRMELSLFNIKVIVVEPGQTNTNFGEIAFDKFLGNTPQEYIPSKKRFYNALYSGFRTATSSNKVANVIYSTAVNKFTFNRYTVSFFEYLFLQLLKFLPDKVKDFFIKLFLM